jgi:hypothetical protein
MLEYAYRDEHPYELFREIDPATGDKLYKARLTSEIPAEASAIAFDIFNELRSALDHAVFDAAVLLGGAPKPKYTKFPFGSDAESAANDLPRKRAEVPECIRPFLLSFKPYPAGNRALWALNEMRNGKIHQTLVGSVGAAQVGFNEAIGSLSFDMTPIRDMAKNEITYMRVHRGSSMKGKGNVTALIAFAEGSAFSGDPAVIVFEELFDIVGGIITGIEAETGRLLRT